MDDATRLRLRDLLATQKALLSAVASGARAPNEAEADYRRVHSDPRQILTAENRNCVCPWGSVHQWAAYAGASADWEDLLNRLIGPYEVLAAHTEEDLGGSSTTTGTATPTTFPSRSSRPAWSPTRQ